MDSQQVKLWESRCIEEAPPACNAACPVHLDVRGMAELIAKGDIKAAYALFCRFIPFPGIIGHLCDHPCETACRRSEAGEAIRIHELERMLSASCMEPPPLRRGRAVEKKRVAVVGGGLSGLTVAADLIVKGHHVVVYETKPELFSRLRSLTALPSSAIEADLLRFENTGIEFLCNRKPDIAMLAEEFDAVYLGIGPQPMPVLAGLVKLTNDDRIQAAPLTLASSHAKIFAGGSHRYDGNYSPIASLYDGRSAALSIERVLQGASLTANRENQGSQPTRLYVNIARHAPLSAIQPATPAQGYTLAEAQREAARCFPCHCLECVKVCPYLEHYGAYPKRYIREIYNNETIVMGARKSNRMIDSCTLCGLCAEVCPEQLGMGEVCLSARQGMVEKGRMPISHHDFALRDLEFSRSEAFAFASHQPGHTESAAVFYPGCQLAGSSPEHVEKIYAHLCQKIEGGVGLMLGCCGAPAQWAARTDLFNATRAEFHSAWSALGKPTIISACSSCYRMFTDHYANVAVEALWTTLERIGLPDHALLKSHPLAIHDPCTTRHETAVHQSIRRLAAQCGVDLIELDGPERTSCCGFGGLAAFANPTVADKIIDQRIAQSTADYLTYCAMCRDNFARRGKNSVHILDLLYPSKNALPRSDPGFSARQESRGRLKKRLQRDLWGKDLHESLPEIDIIISAEVHADLEKKLILLDDIRQTLLHAERSGEKLLDKKNGHMIACHRPLRITYWVEYTVEKNSYLVHRAYSHRMELEMVP
ncbi:pyridine nucleotide-disulfide oxidoreductase/dicluster-binding protein [Uliginosibacterium gangwonense]|uniref:pyridine nucleotide-disulfide oxidoreductase/dicluster-binding protein n=1 Tax=Uliginosibacterium gangwonense TaxID=392736 RepID=UPI0003716C14|nr:pyridine nucleotide-disulfide oxidoreductase/dicluster-binding protein [Uliginosibacterium gangwonense]